jgi:hypothetical protein
VVRPKACGLATALMLITPFVDHAIDPVAHRPFGNIPDPRGNLRGRHAAIVKQEIDNFYINFVEIVHFIRYFFSETDNALLLYFIVKYKSSPEFSCSSTHDPIQNHCLYCKKNLTV